MPSDFAKLFMDQYSDTDEGEAASGGPSDFSKQFFDAHGADVDSANVYADEPEAVAGAAQQAKPGNGIPWGRNQQFANAFFLGGGIPAGAYGRSLLGEGSYDDISKRMYGAKGEYEKQHPTKALVADIAGSTLPILAATRLGQAYMAEPAIASIAGRLPRVAEMMGSRAVGGAAQGAFAGAAQGALTPQSEAEDTGMGAMIGSGVNMLTHGMAAPLLSRITPAVAARAEQFMNAYGINLRPGQIPGAPPISRVRAGTSDQQVDQIHRAISQTFGEDTPTINRQLLRDVRTDLGQRYDTIEAAHGIPPDPALLNQTAALRARVRTDLAGNPAELRRMENLIDRVDNSPWQQGGITGESYHNIIKRGSELDRAIHTQNSVISPYATELRQALNQSWQRNLPPDALQEWNTLNRHYRNAATVWPAAGEDADRLNMNRLSQSVRSRSRHFGQNPGELGDITSGWEEFLAPGMKGDNPLTIALGKHKGAGMAVGALGALGLSHGYQTALELAGSNPTVAAGLGALATGYGAAVPLMTSEGYARALAQGGGRIATGMPNPLIPPMSYLKPGYSFFNNDENERNSR